MARVLTFNEQMRALGLEQMRALLVINIFTCDLVEIYTNFHHNSDVEIRLPDEFSTHCNLISSGWEWQKCNDLISPGYFGSQPHNRLKDVVLIDYSPEEIGLLSYGRIYYNPKSCIYKTATLT